MSNVRWQQHPEMAARVSTCMLRTRTHTRTQREMRIAHNVANYLTSQVCMGQKQFINLLCPLLCSKNKSQAAFLSYVCVCMRLRQGQTNSSRCGIKNWQEMHIK